MTRILILGAGVSGLAAARLAGKLGMAFAIYDESPSQEALGMGFSVASGPWDPILLHGVDLVVTSPGFSERSAPIVESLESGLEISSEIEFASRSIDIPMAAVTGTNGKTTVTEATAAMLDASGLDAPATGNIGSPLSDCVGGVFDALVVEVSSFQLRFTEQFHPVAAAITNVAVDHLDWHGSAYSYKQAKARIYANQTERDLLVFDVDDDGASELAAAAPSETLPVSGLTLPEGGAGVRGMQLLIGEVTIDIAELTSSDPTHLVNIACAAALAQRLGASNSGVVAGAIDYRPGAHRRSVILESGGVRWVDDSKATNPHAAIASVRAHGPVILIAGGLDKGLNLSPLAAEPNLRMLIGIGEAGPALVADAGAKGALAGTLEKAVEIAHQSSDRGDTVLLAPGCASFDQFSSYQERGELFAELVKRIAK